MSAHLKKYWWLLLLTVAVLILKLFPGKLPFLEKIDAPESVTLLNSQQSNTLGPGEKQTPLIISDNELPQWVAEELAALKSGETLSQWKISHPSEEVVLFSPDQRPKIHIDTTWCAGTKVSTNQPEGQGTVRYAIFYPPVAPDSFALPTEIKAEDNYIDNQCTLGLIWIQRSENDDTHGNQIALQIRDAIDRRLGKGQADVSFDRFDAKYLSKTGRWQVGEAVFISAYNTFPTLSSVNYRSAGFEKKFIALGFLPLSGFYGDGKQSLDTGFEIGQENNVLRIRKAVETANISRHDGETLLSYFTTKGGRPSLQPAEAESLVTLLERWVTASEQLDKTRKAAGFIAADQVLAHMEGSLGFTDIIKGKPDRLLRLEKHGAKFGEWEQANAFSYSHSWLQRAREIDEDGPMGDTAFRIMMDMGCSGGSMQYQEVIDQGEAYLKKDKDTNSRAEVEFMVAEAYRDIVALSAGAAADSERPEAYKEMAVAARQKSILHYRNSLPLLKPSSLTREAWREAWRLGAGLPPAHLRYYCIGD